jgi:hypothetical protein
MPQLVFRVVSQVPTDATDIRDAGDAGLGRIDALRFRASALRVAALFLAGLALIVALTALPGILGRLRGGRARRSAGVSEAAVLHTAARRLGEVIDRHPTGDLDAAALADAHHLVRLVAAVAAGLGVRQVALARNQAVPEGRVLVRGWLGRARAAVTSNVTAEAATLALDALTAQRSANDRMRLESLRDALALMTQAQYGAEAAPARSDVLAALRVARDAAGELAGQRRWSLRPIGPPPAASAMRDF